MMLDVRDLHTAYGDSKVLFGMNLSVAEGEVVTLLGRNGMGKTTTIRSILGLVRPTAGTIQFDGSDVTDLPAYRIAQRGIGIVPEGRQIFGNLDVTENLVATAANRHGRTDFWTLDRVFSFFPRLAERRRNMGSQLSGGEQQMLAIGRALMTNPKLLILDEATEGLAPLIRQEIWGCLTALKNEGQSILVVDKNVDALLKIADRHVIIERGCLVWTGDTEAFKTDDGLKKRYLGI